MFKLNIRVLLAVSLVLFVFYSMVNVAETGSFSLVEKVANRTKRQAQKFCVTEGDFISCTADDDCIDVGCSCKLIYMLIVFFDLSINAYVTTF